jgi:ABC-type sugar transport system ATPase subunit
MSDAHSGIGIRGLRKHYGSTVALDSLDLDLPAGEVIGIAGPNGAGKSTLIRILAGEEVADQGTLTVAGVAWSPLASWTQVAVVHQEPQLFPNLTVAENMMVGREGDTNGRPRLTESDRALMEALGIAAVANLPLSDCTLAIQQRTEIARALARDARIFLFDEPNSALTDDESDELFREMQKIAAAGRVVILVSHRLGDLVENCTQVAIIRDGRARAVVAKADLTEEAIARQLVVGTGQESDTTMAPVDAEAGEEIFRVAGWSHGSQFRDVDFSVAGGEIVALMGVEGSGARELLRSFAGLERCSGSIRIAEVEGNATFSRTAFVPATRQLSLYGNLSVGENLLTRLGAEISGRTLWLKRKAMREIAQMAVETFLIKTRNLTQSIRALSGGNQQKVAIAQALTCKPQLILLEEPTRGVDIQSKREIYRLLRAFASTGTGVILFCTEVLEIFETADRVLVVSDGRLSPALRVGDYAHVEVLATAITKLERHGRQPEAAAA